VAFGEFTSRGTAFAQFMGTFGLSKPATAFRKSRTGGFIMLQWTLTFLIVALIAGAFGFFGLEGAAMQIARFTFLIFLVLFVVSLVFGRRPPVV
jgi:uncharacterized membrane protein YtjA (UPF0391 family)